MRRLLCCILAVSVVFCQAFCLSEGEQRKIRAYRFDFKADLNAEKLPEKYRAIAGGFADLLKCLRFCGELYMTDDALFDLHLMIVPNENEEAALIFRIYGSEMYTNIASPLFGNTVMEFLNTALNEFALKIRNHMNIPLQYLCILFPFVRANTIMPFVDMWNETIVPENGNENISGEKWRQLSEKWRGFIKDDWYFDLFLTSIGIESGKDDLLRDIFESVPDEIENNFADGVDVRRENGKETWSYGSKILFEKKETENQTEWRLTLPPLLKGRVKVTASAENKKENREGTSVSDHIIRFRMEDKETGLLTNLDLDMKGIPDKYPADTDISVVINLTGVLFPELSVKLNCHLTKDGSIQATVDWRPGEANEKKQVLTIEGTFVPFAPEKEPFFDEEGVRYFGVFFLNDTLLSELLHEVMEPIIRGMLLFISEIPVSACQSILDVLTETGFLDILTEN